MMLLIVNPHFFTLKREAEQNKYPEFTLVFQHWGEQRQESIHSLNHSSQFIHLHKHECTGPEFLWTSLWERTVTSYGCYNNLPQTGWSETTEIYSLTDLEDGVQNSHVTRAGSFWRLWGRIWFLSLLHIWVGAATPWQSVTCKLITPISPSLLSSHRTLLYICVFPPLLTGQQL